ncbi:MAG TPA: HEAT repeat domain-containing protein [Acidimicrobiia bacterium]
MPTLGPELDAARARVVARGLTVKALGQLTPLVAGLGLSLEALGPVKQLQKRFFSDVAWTPEDDDALTDAIGPGADDVARYELEPGLTLFWGWEGGRFRLRVASDEPAVPAADDDPTAMELGQLFGGLVAPEATPSPRTIRFATPPIHAGPGRAYGSTAAADADPRVARIFQAFDDVTDVLVGPNFVAVTISRPGRWESRLGPMLRAVAEEFTGDGGDRPPALESPFTASGRAGSDPEQEGGGRPARGLERAWADLGLLRADRPEDLSRVLAAAHDDNPARRQVAAALLADAPLGVATRTWAQLLGDPSRMVRRSVIDVVVGAGRQVLRPLVEQALDDSDAWVRWKALRGIAALGMEASRGAVETRTADPDFRVRLEAARILSGGPAG